MELRQGGFFPGYGVVHFEHLPSPRVAFSLALGSIGFAGLEIQCGEAQLYLGSTNDVVEVDVTKVVVGSDVAVRGRIKGRASIGSSRHIRRVRFHLVNFHDYYGTFVKHGRRGELPPWQGRLRFQSDDWVVTLDAVPGPREVHCRLKDFGGFAVTHIGEIERTDGRCLTEGQARDVIDALFWLFSFSRGFWSPPILPVGFDERGRRVWQEWSEPRATGWREVDSWFDEMHAATLGEIFPQFMQRWADPAWHDPLTLAIHWYVEANRQAGAVEGSIILTQAALELLGWVILVEGGQGVSKKEFDERMSAQSRIERLLSHVGIPTGLPCNLAAIVSPAPSGPKVIVDLRDASVHAKANRRLEPGKIPPRARTGAWILGLWYLELTLLWVLGFQGSYSNRLADPRWRGEVERVPWASP